MGIIKKIHGDLLNKKYSARELAAEYIARCTEQNPQLNAYISLTEKQALSMAEKVDKKIGNGENISLLAGIPFGVKDNIVTKGIPTTCGSKMLKNFVPVYNAQVCDLLEKNGAVMLGKTNMDEFGMGSSSEKSVFGAVHNPTNPHYSAGGSSGGSAAAVCGNMAVFALGSDTGGSVRQPASFCGVLGLKPTYGAVSRYGLIAYASSLDQIGILARDAEDAGIVFDVISQKDNKDSTCTGFIGKPLENKPKIGVVKGTDICGLSFESCREIEIPWVKYAAKAYYTIACAEAASNLARYDGIRYGYRTKAYGDRGEMILKTRTEGFGEEVKKRIMFGNLVLSREYYEEYYMRAVCAREHIKNELETVFKEVDVIACPVTKSPVFLLGGKIDKNELVNEGYAELANLAGLPAVSVPCGTDKNGMPKGLQLIGRKYSEKLLLKVAAEIQKEGSADV